MLTDVAAAVEEEFELKEEELWYNKQDLEHDLHLAAELGKTLLDRNHELEQALQQMYSTNQEQLQEIEYLTKQVDLLRQMNEQHAKVYEQLDVAARDLELNNRRLVGDNRAAQQKIHSLTETIDGLQTSMEDLQRQVELLKAAQSERSRKDAVEQRRSLGAQSISCLKELYDLHPDRCLLDEGPRGSERSWLAPPASRPEAEVEEDNAALRGSIQMLETQLEAERGRRQEVEHETELMAEENSALEQRLGLLEGCRRRQAELETEVEELRQLWRVESANARMARGMLRDDAVFAPVETFKPVVDEEEDQGEEDREPRGRPRCRSDSLLRGGSAEEFRRGHERTCVQRPEVVQGRGVSLFSEVDAQYSALQLKYEELLHRCQQGVDSLSHKAVQTPGGHARRRLSSSAASATGDGEQPEYKALFQEIFTCIQKTKEDLSENRSKPRRPL
ncbi:cerebellar degeneration-related protein 2 [Denticeps clupeoides]|uniref:Cerebellar degeneration-related protein 2-like n=1 Tax=Denticeps clupeoides TaxID=299321 RepID=A0AAY4BN50_9TELE|nr:cerebellar degeneration-related protein 2 [Denticeps clupeoides]